MTEKELQFLSNELRKIKLENIWLTSHVKEKNITFSLDMIYNVLKKDNLMDLIIEYNETPTRSTIERRVLIRDNDVINVTYNTNDNATFNKESNLCFVICLDNSKIVTVYYNIADDTHETLIDKRYNEDLIIIK